MTEKTIEQMEYGDIFVDNDDIFIKIGCWDGSENTFNTVWVNDMYSKVYNTNKFPCNIKPHKKYKVLYNLSTLRSNILQLL